MPTTFNVIFLGNQSIIDPIEGNFFAENANLLEQQTFGGVGNALVNDIRSFSTVGNGFNFGFGGIYDQNNFFSNDQFSIDGGPVRTFDALAVYNATLTYVDGTSAQITAVVFQDTNGDTFLAPDFDPSVNQTALEAGAIRSLTLGTLDTNASVGLFGDREAFNFVTCFVKGMEILTPQGGRRVEDLHVGDLVVTRDGAPQPIRWIGKASRPARDNFRPVCIKAGALGAGIPSKDLIVSQQHRMLFVSPIAERMTGTDEVLIPAIKLLNLPDVQLVEDWDTVTYFHLLLDEHQIIYAHDAPTESLLTGVQACKAIGPDAVAEIADFFPELLQTAARPARFIPKGRQVRQLVARHLKNNKPVVGGFSPALCA